MDKWRREEKGGGAGVKAGGITTKRSDKCNSCCYMTMRSSTKIEQLSPWQLCGDDVVVEDRGLSYQRVSMEDIVYSPDIEDPSSSC
jgi:hypothetical protein